MRSGKTLNILSKIVFVIYIILILWVVIFKCNLENSIIKTYEFVSSMPLNERFHFNLIPFIDYFEGPFLSQVKTRVEDDILNLVLFVPLGLYLSYFLKGKKKILKVIVITFLISLSFELFQLFSLIGSFASKDIIINVLGSVIGYFLYRLIYKENNSEIKIKVLNIISLVAIIIFIPICLYAVINTIKVFSLYVDIILRNI